MTGILSMHSKNPHSGVDKMIEDRVKAQTRAIEVRIDGLSKQIDKLDENITKLQEKLN